MLAVLMEYDVTGAGKLKLFNALPRLADTLLPASLISGERIIK